MSRQRELVEPLEITPLYLHGNDAPLCPYCGRETSDDLEFDAVEVAVGHCEECAKDFHVERALSVTYTTAFLRKKPEATR